MPLNAPPPRMIAIPGGRFAMGSERFYPEEAPVRAVAVDAFWIDETPVTNAEFGRFVAATGYRTFAEGDPDRSSVAHEAARAGSFLFVPTRGPIDLSDWSQWWTLSPGTNWRHPLGPDSDLKHLLDHPVVHITPRDAAAFAQWAGKAIPTEAEWEYAARGGLDGFEYAWGDGPLRDGRFAAKIWHGRFPYENLWPTGYERTAPVRRFAPNGYGAYDMIGNVWEWTADAPEAKRSETGGCCTMSGDSPVGGGEDRGSVRIAKGGSYLCAPEYCHRFRPAARLAQPCDSPASHIGFRCVWRGSDRDR